MWWLVRRPVDAFSASSPSAGCRRGPARSSACPWDDARERRYRRFARAVRALHPLVRRLPPRLRLHPIAARAFAREARRMTLPPRVTQGYVDGLLSLVAASGDPSAATAPFTGEPLPAVPQSSAADVAEAARRARVAQERWAGVPLAERSRDRAPVRLAAAQGQGAGPRRRAVGDRQVPGARRASSCSGCRRSRRTTPRHAPTYLAETRPASGRARHRAHPGHPAPQGPGRRDRALELPALPRRRRRDPGAAGRQRGAQQGRLAGAAEPAGRARAGRARPACPTTCGRWSPAAAR